MFHELWSHYERGGWPMHGILVLYSIIWGVGIERAVALYRASHEKGETAHEAAALVRRGYAEQAAVELARLSTPVARVLQAGLLASVVSVEAMRAAFRGAVLAERPRIHRRAVLPKQLGDIAILFGLFGTINGLTTGTGCVSHPSAGTKAQLLAQAIAEALGCTAFGLLTATVAVAIVVLVDQHRRRALHNLDYSVAVLMNAVLVRRRDLRLFGQRDESAPRGYRD